MSGPLHGGGFSLGRLGSDDLVEAFGFLDRDPVVNVYLVALLLRDALRQPRDEYWAARRGGVLAGLLHLGGRSGAILPVGEDVEALRLLGEQASRRLAFLPDRFQVVGPRSAVDPFLERFARAAAIPRLDRPQLYLVLEPDRLSAFPRVPELRPAAWEDLALVHESGAQLRLEELDEDPRETDPTGYRRRVEQECRDGHTFLWKDAAGLRFRASVGAITADAAQVSGVYTPPERRNLGHASRGLAELCTRLFARTRAICLFVNQDNAAARAVYDRLGFRTLAPWRSLFYATIR